MSLRSSARNNRHARLASRLAALTLLAAVLAGAQPRLVIEGGREFDFGELHTTSPVVRELRISNGGTDTLRITDVSGSCGCTGTLLSDSDLLPGESAILKITFDPSKFRGKVDKTVSMRTNDPADAFARVMFTAEVRPVLDIDESHLTFSTIVDSAMAVEVSVRNASLRTLRITGAVSSSEDLAVRMSRDLLEPGGTATLHCTLKQRKAGILRGTITLTTDHPELPSMVLPVFSFAKSTPNQSPGSSSR